MYELMTSKEIQVDISKKIKRLRLNQNRTQESFAKSIGLPKSTYIRFESSGEGSFENFIRIMQGIGRISELEGLLKVESYSPLEAIKNAKKTPPRARASSLGESGTLSIESKKEEKSFLDKIKESKNG